MFSKCGARLWVMLPTGEREDTAETTRTQLPSRELCWACAEQWDPATFSSTIYFKEPEFPISTSIMALPLH